MVDAATNAPIAGTVVIDLEAANGDYSTVMETTADEQGNFTFSNVPSGKAYAVVVSAQSGSNFYVPAMVAGGGPLAPNSAPWANAAVLGPGSTIPPIALTLPSGASSMTVSQAVTSQGSNGGVPVDVGLFARELVTDWEFTFPLMPPASVTTELNPACVAGEACATAQIPMSSSAPVFASYDPSHLTFQTAATTTNANIVGSATIVNTNTPDCNPSTVTGGTVTMMPGQSVSSGATMAFAECQ